jgi:hypothetical protein
MIPDQGPRREIVILAVLAVIATGIIAGCADTAQEQQGQVTAAGTLPGKGPAPVPATTTGTMAAVPLKTTGPARAPVSSTGVIQLDPISDMTAGEQFVITGTTSLPEGSVLLWQVMPDTGTPPAGLDGDSQMSVGGNNFVTKGEGTKNRISLTVFKNELIPGKYVAIVGNMKGDPAKGVTFEIGDDYGYTCFTLK